MGGRDPQKLGLNYDEVMDYIGQFGRFQRRIFLWLSLVSGAAGLAVVVFAFTAFTPSYRCRVPDCDQAETSDYSAFTQFLAVENVELADRCKMPVFENGQCSGGTYKPDNVSKFCNQEDLIFDQSVVTKSLVEDFGFVCGNYWQRDIYSALYMLGMLFGSYFFGWVSDKYGRKNALMASIITVSISGFLGAFTGGDWGHHGFGLLRFITGMGGIGCFMVCFVLAVEHVGFKFTMLVGIAIEIPFALGEAVLGVEAVLVRNWRDLQVLAYLPLLLLVALYWVVPESVRWLLSHGRVEEAKEIIERAARENNKKVPVHLMRPSDMSEIELDSNKDNRDAAAAEVTVLDLFRTRVILFRTLNMCYQWFSVTMCYYGLSFASTSLSGNPYSNFFLSVFIEIPGYIFCILVMDCWGRRPILSFCQILSGVACIICGLLQGVDDPGLQILQILMSLVGKFGASACFAIVYVYTAEMFPTVIRNQAVGTCSLVARIGGVISLLLDLLKVYWRPAPVFIMGVVATLAGVLAVFFPETLGEKLPETIEDALKIGSGKNRNFFACSCRNMRRHCSGEEDFEKVSSTDDEESETS